MKIGAQIVGDARGGRTPFDGQWLVEYDPTRPGVAPDGRAMTVHIVCTPDPHKAQVFESVKDLHELWTRSTGRTRPDGQPDRPLTAFNLAIQKLPDPVDTPEDGTR
jgi:hypothetical protein